MCQEIRLLLVQKPRRMHFLSAMDSQLVSRSDLMEMEMEMENRLIKWSIALALGQVAIISALVKLL